MASWYITVDTIGSQGTYTQMVVENGRKRPAVFSTKFDACEACRVIAAHNTNTAFLSATPVKKR